MGGGAREGRGVGRGRGIPGGGREQRRRGPH